MIDVVYTGAPDVKAFKEVSGELIPAMLESDPNTIYLDADLMSCIGTAKYAKAHPDRAINCGISEGNMIGIAAGLSAAGFKPICHTFGPFASRRCYDQVFLSAGYANNPITVIGSDPGVTAAFNGGTHMPFEDMALYRAIPNATVVDVSDTTMLRDVLPKLNDMPGVKYIRMPRKSGPRIYGDGSEFEIGKGVTLRGGNDAAIIACGIMTGKAMAAAEILAEKGIHVTVVDMFTVKPLDAPLVLECAKRTGCVVTAENHNKIGGLYSAVSECIVRNMPVQVGCVAVEDEFGEVGPQDYLEERFDLTAAHIVREVEATLKRK